MAVRGVKPPGSRVDRPIARSVGSVIELLIGLDPLRNIQSESLD